MPFIEATLMVVAILWGLVAVSFLWRRPPSPGERPEVLREAAPAPDASLASQAPARAAPGAKGPPKPGAKGPPKPGAKGPPKRKKAKSKDGASGAHAAAAKASGPAADSPSQAGSGGR